jgi:hypothetical protein
MPIKITENEQIVLNSIGRNYYAPFNGGRPPEGYKFDVTDFAVWSDCIGDSDVKNVPSGKKLSGTVSKLSQKGLIKSDGECVALTQEGFNLVEWN